MSFHVDSKHVLSSDEDFGFKKVLGSRIAGSTVQAGRSFGVRLPEVLGLFARREEN